MQSEYNSNQKMYVRTPFSCMQFISVDFVNFELFANKMLNKITN